MELYVTWFGYAFSLLLKRSPGLGEVDAREVMGTEYNNCATIFKCSTYSVIFIELLYEVGQFWTWD